MDSLENGAGQPLSPLCRELRSKKIFTLTSIPLDAADVIDLSNHCWCRRTMQTFGPDGDRARPEKCSPGRPCYQSHFE